MANEVKEWRALVGLDYVDGDGNEVHADPGDKLIDLPENVVKHEHAANNIEKWESGKTDNVRDQEAEYADKIWGVFIDDHGVATEVIAGEVQNV